MLKLYVVVRNDIDIPFQMCQVAHAVANFATEHPGRFKIWNTGTNTICVLQARDEIHLRKLIEIAVDGNFHHTVFNESDAASIGFQTRYDPESKSILDYGDGPWPTAVAFAPDWFLQNVVFADLPLAFNSTTMRDKVGLFHGHEPIKTSKLKWLRERAFQLSKLEEYTPKQRRRYFKNLKGN